MSFKPSFVRSFPLVGLGAALLCAAPAWAQNDELIRPSGWHWTKITDSMSESAIADPDAYLIVFSADGTLNVKADCANVSGTYALDGNGIAITLADTPEADCGADSDSSELVETLPYSEIWSIDQRHTLTLAMFGEAGSLTFRPAE